ncbi:hypothetical protein BSKO_09560 [Bryopsis sp. KO-2023]|nr:hypothetical protein BSKO_09560 [Bryopsis sp. KO-2023]
MASFCFVVKALIVAFALSSVAAFEVDQPADHFDHARKLLAKLPNPASLIRAASSGETEQVETLLAAGVNVDAINPIGWSALTAACTANHLATVEALIEAGADIDHEAAGGITPLMAASTEGHLEVIRFLLESGADRNIEAAGKTALDMVCSCTTHRIGLIFRHCNKRQCANTEDIIALFSFA